MSEERLTEGEEDYVIRLVNYFQCELENGGPLIPLANIQERAAEALNISKRTVVRVVQKHYSNDTQPEQQVAEASTSSQKKFHYTKRKKWKTEDVPDGVKIEVQNVLQEMVEKKQHLTVKTLQQQLVERHVLEISESSLRRLLHHLGFSFTQDAAFNGS